MRASIEKYLLRHWYGQHRPPLYLRLLEPVYRFFFQRAHKRQQRSIAGKRNSQPLIVVGNITAGGTGKTPLVIALSRLALELKLKPGIVSTGYGRQSRESFIVSADSDTGLCGDEPVLLAKRSGASVVVAARRIDAIKKLQGMAVNIIISDDGLQQSDLCSDVDICVIDGARGLGNGHLIPAGPLRESPQRLQEVDWVVSNGEWPGKPEALTVCTMQLEATVVQSLDDKVTLTLAEFKTRIADGPLFAVAAIGNPQRFFTMLEQQGMVVTAQSFADHHRYTRKDFRSIPSAAAVIMTEKDAVKCRGLKLENAWYIPVSAVLPDDFRRDFKARLLDLVMNL